MNETNSHLPPVQGENGLFVPITLEEMAKSPEIFGRAGAVCSEVAGTPPVVPQKLQNAVTEPKVQRLNCANASEIFYLVVNILNQQKPLWRYQNHFYMKENNVYVPYNKKEFICRVYSDVTALGYEFTQPAICSITNELEMRADLYQGEPNDERYTYCSNGFLNNRTGLFDIVSDYFPTIQLTGAYLGSGPQYHPNMDRFMSILFAGDKMLEERAYQIIGYCISSDAHAKRFFVFPGASGDNGKSTFIHLIRSLLSPSAVKGLSMKNLLGGNFAMSEIQEARINVSSDEGTLELNTDQLAKLKSISGHDRLTVDKKNSNQVSFTSTCKVIIASNHNIGMAYSSSDSAIARRICTLPFDVKIPKSQQNPNIVSEILGSELNAVTTEALNAFFRLKANGYHFAGDDAGLDDYALQFTPINAQYHNIERFVQCHVRSMPGNFVLTKDLYDVFQHCLDFNCDVFKDVTGFSQALNNYLLSNGYVVKKVKKHQGNGYEGIAISNP